MTTRESLHELLDTLTDDEVEVLADIARMEGLVTPRPDAAIEQAACIQSRQYPVLAALWDNDDDAIFDTL